MPPENRAPLVYMYDSVFSNEMSAAFEISCTTKPSSLEKERITFVKMSSQSADEVGLRY